MKNLYRSLYFQVLVAIALGIFARLYLSRDRQLSKMLIAPVIFCTVVMGISGVEDMKKVGKTGRLVERRIGRGQG